MTRAAADHGVDVPMDLDPAVGDAPRVARFSERLKGMWLAAMEQPGADLRMRALDAFTQAKLQGLEGLEDLADKIAGLVAGCRSAAGGRATGGGADVDVRARCAADGCGGSWHGRRRALLEFSLVAGSGRSARWKTAGAADLWLARVKERASEQLVCSAIRSLGETAPAEAVEPLTRRVGDVNQGGVVRLAAARALSSNPTEPVISLAESLAGHANDHLLAAAMAPASKNPHAVKLLVRLAQDAGAGGGDDRGTEAAGGGAGGVGAVDWEACGKIRTG